MNRDEAKAYLKSEPRFINEYLTRAGKEPIPHPKNGKCPICGGGSKTPNTGIKAKADGSYYLHCFACDWKGDLFDLIGQLEGIPTEAARFERAYSLYGIEIEGQTPAAKPPEGQTERQEDSNASSFTGYYKKVRANAEPAIKYLLDRGISGEVIARHNVGYDRQKQAIVIPITDNYYYSRSISGKRFYNPAGATVEVYNKDLIKQEKPVYVVEGLIDAMSIETAGGQAIALHSTSNYSKLINLIKENGKAPTLILALDNDEDGEKATVKLAEALDNLEGAEAIYLKADLYEGQKDANDLLRMNPSRLQDNIDNITESACIAEQSAIADRERKKQEALKEYRDKNSTAGYLPEFFRTVEEMSGRPAIPTGFPALDKNLDGGFYEGLYILGAISSLGKTTLALQIADNVAASGTDVLIFSLEMARFELAAKSISRNTFLLDESDGHQLSKTTRGIMNGAKYQYYTEEENTLISYAVSAYAGGAQNTYIIEGNGNIGAAEIREYVRQHIKLTDRRPLVVIDYLQILKPVDTRATDKTNTDLAVNELKRISRDYKCPVFAISSLNRSNYTAPVNMAAFKESGAIEYSSDVLMGLQVNGADEFTEGNKTKSHKETEQQKLKDPRELQLKILKNRNGRISERLDLFYYPKFNMFEDATIF